MLVGTLQVEVHIPGATSLKEKRKVVRSMIQKVQHRFNVSIAELDGTDLWQRATIGVAMVGGSREYVERQLQYVLNYLEAEPRWNITEVEMDWC
ncbi:MAG TPA: DUF503 domain-containing protein [Firmicutes bacterium]|jgi:uncharacterized protein YlxP (DUF503 family)|nr:DUF503 domain-containing protein [Bacillota bacterium]HHT42413.1 DUF503 domain-containing protein [Bacillota bacterium]